MIHLLQGIGIGFVIAAPIGPVGILCIRKALADGRGAAFVAGLGAAVADTVFGAVVGLGLGTVSHFLDGHQTALKLVGGLFLLVLGVRSWRAAAFEADPDPGRGPGLWRDFISTFLITITNPGTILGVMGVFAALGATAKPDGAGDGGLLVGGIFLGSALWWLALSWAASAVRDHFTPQRMRRFNHVSGAVLVAFGIGALASLLWSL